ncbi:MAG: nucleoside hydrolase [Acidobacteria bacterium]|nr:nucleoside hydrolase [Acidobacteriota bacterium]
MTKLLIDTDTASDDAVALLMALRHPDAEVVAITIVSGNVEAELGARNARYTVELCGRRVPVFKGLDKPLLRPHENAKRFHGQDGLGNMNCPEPLLPLAEGHALDALIRFCAGQAGQMTLVTLGPLTNIAAALLREPRLAGWVKEAFVMGGAANVIGNVTPSAEYNIWCDPEAARIVFHSGMKILMIGWEHSIGAAVLSPTEMKELEKIGTPYARFVLDCNRQVVESGREFGIEGMTLPDPVAMAIALDRRICTRSIRAFVDVETLSELTRGETVVDRLGVLNQEGRSLVLGGGRRREANVEVCLAIDARRFKQILFQSVR